jgi:hypothetical protein
MYFGLRSALTAPRDESWGSGVCYGKMPQKHPARFAEPTRRQP